MDAQNVFTVVDEARCLNSTSEGVLNYLDGVYRRASRKVSNISEPIDWLLVNSDDLFGVVNSSQDYFEGRLEMALKGGLRRSVNVVKDHGMIFEGRVERKDIEEHILGKLKEGADFNYLNSLCPGPYVSLFRLNMRTDGRDGN